MASSGNALPELTPDEEFALLETFKKMVFKARTNKDIQRRKDEYARAMMINTNPPSSLEDFKAEIMRRGQEMASREAWDRPFTIDENNKPIFSTLANYFFGNETKFEGRTINPKKSLLLYGNVGCGKTVALKLFEKNPLQCFQLVSCRTIEAAYDQRGTETIAYYSGLSQIPNPTQNYGHTYRGFAFDDLGTESEAKHFGKVQNIMETIILNRYDDTALRGPFSHITTNLDTKEIADRYGIRAFDRFKQMYNIINFPENSTSRR